MNNRSGHEISVVVNGQPLTARVPARMSLADCLREEWGLTGCHVGCEHGVCGACTVLLDGSLVRACLIFAVQADGARVMTIEGVGTGPDLHPVQEAFWECHALQCGFCTPGMVLTVVHLLEQIADPTEDQIREALAGNLCMCTGYQNIVRAVRWAADRLASSEGGSAPLPIPPPGNRLRGQSPRSNGGYSDTLLAERGERA